MPNQQAWQLSHLSAVLSSLPGYLHHFSKVDLTPWLFSTVWSRCLSGGLAGKIWCWEELPRALILSWGEEEAEADCEFFASSTPFVFKQTIIYLMQAEIYFMTYRTGDLGAIKICQTIQTCHLLSAFFRRQGFLNYADKSSRGLLGPLSRE